MCPLNRLEEINTKQGEPEVSDVFLYNILIINKYLFLTF